ncbi:MAG: hypothetical protein E7167_03535 [Firmicutes bacterium]|nr:hypothetical protein [Bacillota bacterium]
MKKKILTSIMCMIAFLSLAGCGKVKNEFDVGNESNIIIDEQDVSLSIKEGTLTKTGATLILKNKSDKAFEYGNPYEIEIKKDGKWHKINVELNFTMPAFSLKPQELKEIEINWSYGYGTLAPGKYRIIKDVNFKTNEDTYEKFYVSAEFTIE